MLQLMISGNGRWRARSSGDLLRLQYRPIQRLCVEPAIKERVIIQGRGQHANDPDREQNPSIKEMAARREELRAGLFAD